MGQKLNAKQQRFVVYAIRNMVLNQIVYVGSTKQTLRRRLNQHMSEALAARHANKAVRRHVQKYGRSAFNIEPLDIVCAENRFVQEYQRIEEYRAIYPDLLNRTLAKNHAYLQPRQLDTFDLPEGVYPRYIETRISWTNKVFDRITWRFRGTDHKQYYLASTDVVRAKDMGRNLLRLELLGFTKGVI